MNASRNSSTSPVARVFNPCRLLLFITFTFVLPSITRAFEPTDQYDKRQLEGFSIRISSKLLDHKDLAERTLALLQIRLYEMKRALPAQAMEHLQGIFIWIELDDAGFPGMCYHPSRDWLREHDYNPDKANGIEIGNARHFLDWSAEQPCMVLHEFAHAYHHNVLGEGNADVKGAYDAAVKSGKYDHVLRASGKTERHYALNNDEEFFAEMSESYFGTNDFYPFVRAELKDYDPASYALVRRMWTNPPTTRSSPTSRTQSDD